MSDAKSTSIPSKKKIGQASSSESQSTAAFGEIVLCDDEIREAAYYQWEAEGCPCCDGVEFWLKAKAELIASTERREPE
ncbi:MAG: DUF2934 domain-containing protein [Pirellulaceae bacterium]|nr:DUF2934 domain-containing protein [Pirellulaceae bacterium]